MITKPRLRTLSAALTALLALALTVAGLTTIAASPAAAALSSGATGARVGDYQVRVGVATHNVLRGRAHFVPHAQVIGWQEVNDRPDRAKMRRSLRTFDHFVPKADAAAAVSISWRERTWDLVEGGSVRTHDGRAKVTPARYINWVVLEKFNGKRITFVNTHFISGAFKSWKSHRAWREQQWNTHRVKLVNLLDRLEGKGYPMFVVGDFNYPGTLDLPGVVRAKVAGRAIDQIYGPAPRPVTSADRDGRGRKTAQAHTRPEQSTVRARRLGRYGSDHPAYKAVYFVPRAA